MSNNSSIVTDYADPVWSGFVAFYLGLSGTTFTSCLVYLLIRASTMVAACWEMCLRGNPRVDGDGCNPMFLLVGMLVAYTWLLYGYVKHWPRRVVNILLGCFLGMHVLCLVVYFGLHWYKVRQTRQPTSQSAENELLTTRETPNSTDALT